MTKDKKRKPVSKLRKTIDTIILIVCLGVFSFSAFNLFNIYMNYRKINTLYNNISTEFTSVKEKDKYLKIDWDKLLKRNKDIRAWIQVPGTEINYPVLQGTTNDTYIRHDLDHKHLTAGSIFIDSDNRKPFIDLNTVIYGHNMYNGSMFSNLKKYNQEYTKEHPYIYIYLPNNTVSIYKVVSSHVIDAYSDLYDCYVTNAQNYYANMLKTSKIKVDFDKTKNNPIITLSTCTDAGSKSDDRHVVHAILQEANIDPATATMPTNNN